MTRPRGPTRPTRLALLAALAVVVAACGADPAPTATAEDETAAADGGHQQAPKPADPTHPPAREEPEPAPDPADASEDAKVVPAILDFVAPGVGGGQVVGAEHAGEALALWFWAPW